jgi:hypothetical protein
MASETGKNRPDMPGRVRQAAVVFVGPDDAWRRWCALALAVNRLHALTCPPRPKESDRAVPSPSRPGPKPSAGAKAPGERDPWPYPLMIVPFDKIRERLLAMATATLVVHEADEQETLRALLDVLVNSLGANRVSMAVVCEQRESPWLKEEMLGRFPVTIAVFSRRGDSLALLRRVRRATDEKRRRLP